LVLLVFWRRIPVWTISIMQVGFVEDVSHETARLAAWQTATHDQQASRDRGAGGGRGAHLPMSGRVVVAGGLRRLRVIVCRSGHAQ